MRNSPTLPTIALVIACFVGLYVAIDTGNASGPLTTLQLGGAGVALALAIFGVQGLISVLIEGQELRPGRTPARLTDPLSAGIVVLSIALFAVAVALGYGIADGWRIEIIGSLAGAGCIDLALLLVFYKEAFVGDEAGFDNRDDGVPW